MSRVTSKKQKSKKWVSLGNAMKKAKQSKAKSKKPRAAVGSLNVRIT